MLRLQEKTRYFRTSSWALGKTGPHFSTFSGIFIDWTIMNSLRKNSIFSCPNNVSQFVRQSFPESQLDVLWSLVSSSQQAKAQTYSVQYHMRQRKSHKTMKIHRYWRWNMIVVKLFALNIIIRQREHTALSCTTVRFRHRQRFCSEIDWLTDPLTVLASLQAFQFLQSGFMNSTTALCNMTASGKGWNTARSNDTAVF